MREIDAELISKIVANLCQEANLLLPPDIISALERASKEEKSPLGREVLAQLLENAQVAVREKIPLCQDTGMAIVFLEIGQEVLITNGDLTEAVNKGVREGYKKGFLRKSVVADPLFSRYNTSDNTPAVIHTAIVPGQNVTITVLIKGGGSEGVGLVKALKPADGLEKLKEVVLKSIKGEGRNSCPPVIVGIGCGGTLEEAALLAKKALLRPVGQLNQQQNIARLERELLEEINALGIGPAGLGGRITALDVHIETYPTHLAVLPLAVDINCYALRRRTAIL